MTFSTVLNCPQLENCLIMYITCYNVWFDALVAEKKKKKKKKAAKAKGSEGSSESSSSSSDVSSSEESEEEEKKKKRKKKHKKKASKKKKREKHKERWEAACTGAVTGQSDILSVKKTRFTSRLTRANSFTLHCSSLLSWLYKYLTI